MAISEVSLKDAELMAIEKLTRPEVCWAKKLNR